MKRFSEAIQGKHHISIIAEIKKKSPSHGPFEKHSVANLVAAYEKGGAAAISVVTEPLRFSGSLELLKEIHSQTSLPIIRKDFIQNIDRIKDSKTYGGSAVLLIAHNLKTEELRTFTEEALAQDLDPVIEVHNEEDIEKIASLPMNPRVIIGINNRNLETLEIDVHHGLKLIDKIDPRRIIIAESAFLQPSELDLYKGKVDAALIGTALLIADNPWKTLTSFVGNS